MHNILSLQKVSKIYKGTDGLVPAVNDVTFDIRQGEIFGLLGINGAGKTTLSSILATLHPATSGDILFEGSSIYTNLTAYRYALGFCPQTQNLDLALSVKENLVFAGRYFLMPETIIAQRVQELIEQLELQRHINAPIHSLSGGTKQRVLIARALMHNPKIVILDEPTVGLDPDIRRKLWSIIRGLKERGITIILTTHYLDEAEVLSDRVCILHKGKVQLIESVVDLKAKHRMDKLEDIFLHLTKDN